MDVILNILLGLMNALPNFPGSSKHRKSPNLEVTAFYGREDKMFKKRSVKQGTSFKRKKVDVGSEDVGSGVVEAAMIPRIRRGRTPMGLTAGDSSKESVEGHKKVQKEDIQSIGSKFELSVDRKTVGERESEPAVSFSPKGKLEGPPENVKVTMLTDFQPDVCKDFKQTGYCGYGDSCKFLHSRDDFKTGWKLNQEWKIDDPSHSKNQTAVAHIPFKCIICKGDYTNPIVTNCGHYFCGSCFTQRVRKDPSCAICGQDTHGVARIAKKLNSILKEQIPQDI